MHDAGPSATGADRGERLAHARGLRVGDSVARLKRLHRGARLTPIPTGTTLERWGLTPLGREWDLRKARPASAVIVVTAGARVVAFELRPAALR